MRPQDVVILLKIIARGGKSWQMKDLASELYISQAEISDSLNRSVIAGLLEGETKKHVYQINLLEFIEHGLHYVFPAIPTGMVNGIPTAHSHPFMKQYFHSELEYVWPEPRGNKRGLAIEPLYKDVPKAALEDDKLYKMLALIDVIRVGKVREWKLAIKELHKIIVEREPSN